MDEPKLNEIVKSFRDIQDEICESMSLVSGSDFREDLWERPGGGGGRTRVLVGSVIEKGGVNFSHVHGTLSDQMSRTLKVDQGSRFDASGVSIVMHPKNPWVPIIHMNIRYFELNTGAWWFGGGIDLTPHYIIEEDGQLFHQTIKQVCDQHGANYYARFKPWADKYFYLKHRDEYRGIGGIFFDHLDEKEGNKSDLFDFVCALGRRFAPIYTELIRRNMDKSYTDQHVDWQLFRRSRYVEFNLVWDRGTKFGLETNGRTESILMSMPPEARWTYDAAPVPGTLEALTYDRLKKAEEWV